MKVYLTLLQVINVVFKRLGFDFILPLLQQEEQQEEKQEKEP